MKKVPGGAIPQGIPCCRPQRATHLNPGTLFYSCSTIEQFLQFVKVKRKNAINYVHVLAVYV